ncbi:MULTISPECIES: pyrroline-5-carboxylate reductase [unclassified Arthrobacter]|uniref:pyrroline-5-carboxylate reductase n=1 Tax=unclassified Arthrobacter TaxID=235627 RepID=UPI001EFFC6DD|nr:pyrroline-5-carboxylate reductase [Arthrobacter sp. FW305-BF8]UKA56162.1 pyrroline-5-carboxylate reductase [Arthrobacter sp. FW305-BF8]
MSMTTAFLGCGSMNEAILAGLLKAGTAPEEVIVTVRRPERAVELDSRYPGLSAMAVQENPESNKRATTWADVVILGVKPAGIADLAREISSSLAPETVVVSVAAAVTLTQLEAALPQGQPVIRALPNTPIKLGRGVVALTPGSHCGPEQLGQVKGILEGTGTVVEVPEEQVNAVSAISGSGPAYAYYLAEAMAAAGAELGLDPELSVLLARETVAGAGLMLAEPGADASALRKTMAGPDSITLRALAVFDERGTPGIITEGARATVDRSAEITQQLRAKRP